MSVIESNAGTWTEVPFGAIEGWRGVAPRAFRHGPLQALVSRDEVADGDLRWHVSVTHTHRVPTWDELVDAAHALRPGVVFAIGLPPRSWWLNVHPHCLHLYEIRDPHLVEQWRAERRGDRPT